MFDTSITFHAAVLVDTNSPLKVLEIHPPLLREDEALVRIIYSGICRSQIMEIDGKRGIDKWLPHLLGHEAVGVIEKVGTEKFNYQIGKRVVISWVKHQNDISTNRNYLSKENILINSGDVTTLSQYSVVPLSRLHEIPSNVSDQVATLFGCALLTGGGMVEKYIKEPAVSKVLIIGFGGVGSAAAVMAKFLCHSEPYIAEESKTRQAHARSLGFNLVFSMQDIKRKKIEFDFCFEAGGSTTSIEFGFECIKNSGTLVFASHPPTGEKINIDPYGLITGKKIIGTWGGDIENFGIMTKLISSALELKLDLTQLVGKEFSLFAVNQAINHSRNANRGRTLVKMW